MACEIEVSILSYHESFVAKLLDKQLDIKPSMCDRCIPTVFRNLTIAKGVFSGVGKCLARYISMK